MGFLRIKNIDQVIEDVKVGGLKRTLTAADLLLLGIGAIIGTGIFVMTGVSAANYAGPAVVFSYLLGGLCAMFVALAYTELASMIPSSGGVYTYSYVSLGEFVAWIVGWMVIFEYTVSATTIASGWSGYTVGILKSGGINLPIALTKVPSQGGIIDLPAVLISLFVSFILIRGTRESSRLNMVLVFVKMAAIFIFLVVAVPNFKQENWSDFFPFGFKGVASGAAAIFFAYTGFDMLATSTEECKNPRRDITIGIIGSLFVCTLLYMLVAGMLTGIVHYSTLNNAEPLAFALRANGSNIGSALVATGAIAGMTTVLIVQLYAESRLFYMMSRDGMLPSFLSKVHPKYSTPYISSTLIAVIVAVVAGFVPIHITGSLASMGTLIAFIVVSIIVMVLRKKRPELQRTFRCPSVYVMAPIAIFSCLFLIYHLLSPASWSFVAWAVIGIIIYFGYSRSHSKLK